MKNKKKKIKIKRLLTLLFLMLAIFIAILVIAIKTNEKLDVTYNGEEVQRFTKEYIEGRLHPQGIWTFKQNYKGDVTPEVFYTKLDVAQKFITDLSEILDEKDTEKIYEANSSEIAKYLGIQSKEEFAKVADIIKESKIKNLPFNFCRIESDSYKYENGYVKFNMSFCYENGTEMLLGINIIKIQSKNEPILIISAP